MDEHHDHDGIYGTDISCVICRRSFFPEMETRGALAFDAIPMCRECKSSVFENLGSNETLRDDPERYPRGVRARGQSEDSEEDLFLREFSQLIRLARLGHQDRSLSRWRRVASDNESEGFDQMDHLFTENGSNFSYGGYGGGSDASVDREVSDGVVRIVDTDVDPMHAGLGSWNYEDEDEESDDYDYEEREVTALEADREASQTHVEDHGGTFDFEEEEEIDQIAQEIAEILDRTNPTASWETAREINMERVDRIAREVGMTMDESESRVSWEMSQEMRFEEENVSEPDEESVHEERREVVLETEMDYAGAEWEDDSDEWEEELALGSPDTTGTRRILRVLHQVTDMGNSQEPWIIPREDEFFNYSNLFSELVEYEHTNETNLDELLEHLAEAEGSSRRGAPPASSSFVENIPRLIFSEDQEKNMHIICAICKDPLLAGVKVIQLPCFHFYHSECILPWLLARNSCPLCRYELPTDDLDYERGKSRYLPIAAVDSQPVEVSVEESNDLMVEEVGPEPTGGSSGGDSGRRWIFLAAVAPLVGIVGAVLVLWLGKGERRMGSHGGWGMQLREVPCSPSSDLAPANGAQRNRRWWPFF